MAYACTAQHGITHVSPCWLHASMQVPMCSSPPCLHFSPHPENQPREPFRTLYCPAAAQTLLAQTLAMFKAFRVSWISRHLQLTSSVLLARTVQTWLSPAHAIPRGQCFCSRVPSLPLRHIYQPIIILAVRPSSPLTRTLPLLTAWYKGLGVAGRATKHPDILVSELQAQPLHTAHALAPGHCHKQ